MGSGIEPTEGEDRDHGEERESRRNRKYREEQLEYQKQLSAYQVEWDRKNSRTKEIETEYSDWILNQTEAVRNLKIVIPHELQPPTIT